MGQSLSIVEEFDKSDIVTLFISSDPRHQRSVSYYDYSNTTPFGEGICVVAKDDEDRVLGHYSIIPLEFHFGDEKLKVGYAQQAIVHKEYRNLQLISKLHNFAIEQAKEKFDFLFAFSNDNFMKVKKMLFKWKDLESFNTDVLYLKDLDIKSNNEVVSINCFTNGVQSSDDLFTLNKSKEYLNYRFFQHPINHYKVFGVKEAEDIVGYIALKFYKAEDELIGHFIDFEAKNEKVLESLLSASKEYFSFYGVKKVLFWNRGVYKDTLQKFIKEESFKTNFLLYDFTGKSEFYDKEKWNLSMSLSDAF
jgi:GNAT superfamily N-acetyltransferase